MLTGVSDLAIHCPFGMSQQPHLLRCYWHSESYREEEMVSVGESENDGDLGEMSLLVDLVGS